MKLLQLDRHDEYPSNPILSGSSYTTNHGKLSEQTLLFVPELPENDVLLLKLKDTLDSKPETLESKLIAETQPLLLQLSDVPEITAPPKLSSEDPWLVVERLRNNVRFLRNALFDEICSKTKEEEAIMKAEEMNQKDFLSASATEASDSETLMQATLQEKPVIEERRKRRPLILAQVPTLAETLIERRLLSVSSNQDAECCSKVDFHSPTNCTFQKKLYDIRKQSLEQSLRLREAHRLHLELRNALTKVQLR
jgi:hypothetical protein